MPPAFKTANQPADADVLVKLANRVSSMNSEFPAEYDEPQMNANGRELERPASELHSRLLFHQETAPPE